MSSATRNNMKSQRAGEKNTLSQQNQEALETTGLGNFQNVIKCIRSFSASSYRMRIVARSSSTLRSERMYRNIPTTIPGTAARFPTPPHDGHSAWQKKDLQKSAPFSLSKTPRGQKCRKECAVYPAGRRCGRMKTIPLYRSCP